VRVALFAKEIENGVNLDELFVADMITERKDNVKNSSWNRLALLYLYSLAPSTRENP